jgi:hypothetical protein
MHATVPSLAQVAGVMASSGSSLEHSLPGLVAALEVASHVLEYHVMEFLSVGTAVRPITGDVKAVAPQLVLG